MGLCLGKTRETGYRTRDNSDTASISSHTSGRSRIYEKSKKSNVESLDLPEMIDFVNQGRLNELTEDQVMIVNAYLKQNVQNSDNPFLKDLPSNTTAQMVTSPVLSRRSAPSQLHIHNSALYKRRLGRERQAFVESISGSARGSSADQVISDFRLPDGV